MTEWTLTLNRYDVGTHWYGWLDENPTPDADGYVRMGYGAPRLRHINVEAELTLDWALLLNISEKDFDWTEGVGLPCGRFMTRSAALEAGIATFKANAAPGDTLRLRDLYSDEDDPREAIATV